MPTMRHLDGVIHDIAHHAQSGLSHLHPHLAQLCRSLRTTSITLDLLAAAPLGDEVMVRPALALSTEALRTKFRHLIDGKGLALSDVAEAHLVFTFSERRDDYNSAVRAYLRTARGQTYEHELAAF